MGVRCAMKPSLKYTVLSALVVLAVLYWALAIISDWLTCDDSKAVGDDYCCVLAGLVTLGKGRP